VVLMGRVAAHLGNKVDVRLFRDHAARIATAVNDRLYDSVRGVYVDGPATLHASLHANAFSLMAGLVPESRRQTVADFACSRGMACSVYGAQHVLDGLYKAERADHALALMTATDDRSWHHMIHGVGSTMTLEAWDGNYKPNLDWNHAWGCAPTNVIVRRLLGVRPAAHGFSKARIQPQLGGLEWARARIPTRLGAIELEATRRPDGSPELNIVLPDRMTADLRVGGGEDHVEIRRTLNSGAHSI
jgi:alpha-L-rhamnosidase